MILAIVITIAILVCLCWICLCRSVAKVSRMEERVEKELPEEKEELYPLRPIYNTKSGEVDNWRNGE